MKIKGLIRIFDLARKMLLNASIVVVECGARDTANLSSPMPTRPITALRGADDSTPDPPDGP
ncbi:hypothetical protein [Burkholderia glumae]|uniref:hypothetical protein n=1 Tax=Burkholderia glumae TaxID=337 RepID=UPI000F6008EB|nr:hypothetical protein [Burkholderia glumae]MCM2493510.1 hypothetical protein [Burkholderia glumae]MCM2543930.1 hypothetical protein [Burkholderia glumae]MCQ0030388.1 hypothetical protein [Burkholderia glumae]MCQ0035695.1 hypothetical protein [Burkholderia glumae]MCR1769872.1 hypothetical protein [Burkholderia glumae]